MNKITSLGTVLVMLFSLAFLTAVPAQASNGNVTICHANNGSKGYVVQTIAKEAIFKKGHDQHQDGRDIIPSFTYTKVEDGQNIRYTYPGLNLDKADLLAVGCVEAPETENLVAAPNPPVYNPPACITAPVGITEADAAFYGSVTVPADLGEGVKSATEPVLSEDKSVWTVSYTLADATEEVVYSWPANVTGAFSFETTPLSADPLWVIDADTRVGACELSDTGAGNVMLIVGGGALLLGLGAISAYYGRRTESE